MGTWGDPAKLQFLGKVLGTPHLSGTPLYLILNHVFVTYFPKGTLALKANLLSAIFSIAAVWFLFAVLLDLDFSFVISFITALIFGVGYTMWSWSLLAEVYTLTTLFFMMVIFFLLRWNRTRKNWYFLAACLFYSLSFGNHLLVLGLLPAFIYIVLATDPRVMLDIRNITLVFLFLLLGISQYYYIIWRTNDPSTAFLETDTRKFLAFIVSPGSSAMARYSIDEILTNRLPRFFKYLWREYYFLIFGGLIGFFTIREKVIRRFILIGLLSTFLVAMVRYAREYETYFLPFYVFFIILVGYGLDWIARRLPGSQRLVIIAILIPAVMVWVNYQKVDHHDRTLWARITEKILTTIEQDALILSPNYDNTAFFWYYLIGEGYESRNLYVMPVDYNKLERVKGLPCWGGRILSRGAAQKRTSRAAGVYNEGARARTGEYWAANSAYKYKIYLRSAITLRVLEIRWAMSKIKALV